MTPLQTSLPYHQQDNDELCGHAVAQMMLADPTVCGTVFKQIDLQANIFRKIWRRIRSIITAKPAWNTSPDDMCAILNGRAREGGFRAVVDANALDACARVVSALAEHGVAVPAVVFGSDHWVAISAAIVDGDPASSAGQPCAIKGFFISNPEPAIATSRDHQQDDICGHGGDKGSRITYVTLAAWLELFWDVPCRDFGKRPGYVTVTRAVRRLTPTMPQPPAQCAAPPDGNPVAIVRAGIEENALASVGPLAEGLRTFQPGPVRGMRSDDGSGNPTSYFVDVALADGTRALALVGALDHAFQGIQAPPSEQAAFREPRAIVADVLAGGPAALAALEVMVAGTPLADRLAKTEPQEIVIHPQLVAKRHGPAMSPFRTLIAVDVASARYYVTMDGRVLRGDERRHA